MNKMKTIPTIYSNILFKSKLEVSYAKVFDRYNIKWKYEPETFDLGEIGYKKGKHNLYYTPDFYFPNLNCYLEIKPHLGLNERSKELLFLIHTNKILYFAFPFYPLNEPKYIIKIKNPYKKFDGYSSYIVYEKTIRYNFKDFIKCKSINELENKEEQTTLLKNE